jgi:hypothetical protein
VEGMDGGQNTAARQRYRSYVLSSNSSMVNCSSEAGRRRRGALLHDPREPHVDEARLMVALARWGGRVRRWREERRATA